MILALSQKFGLADGEKVTKSTAKRSANREAGEPSTGGNKQAVNTSRLWTPICHRNLAYEKALAERESEERPDHLKQNIVNCLHCLFILNSCFHTPMPAAEYENCKYKTTTASYSIKKRDSRVGCLQLQQSSAQFNRDSQTQTPPFS
eukprot:m.46748 g.46748  ORF g.46748 m.46748 type:complete len:147 (+) comp33729_c0_seq9:2213-2653(+)